jgi:L-ribulokinase
VYEQLYPLYRDLYFALGKRDAAPAALGDVLPELRRIAAQVMKAA